jgi:RNA polymerase sigma-70 factor (ECF subfamily)
MGRVQRDAIEVPRAWLTRVASRVCLDVLGSARVRRERYVGPWLPEPVPSLAFSDPAVDDPADRVTLDDSISTALLVVLESMTPAERVAFVLHDVFAMPFGEIAEVVGRTPAACRQLATSARRRVQSARRGQVPRAVHDAAVRAFAAARKNPAAKVLELETLDGLGFALWVEGRVLGVVTLEVTADRITDVRMVLDPEKLTLWN